MFLDYLKNLFKKKESVIQTGYIRVVPTEADFKEWTDRNLGAEVAATSWSKYLPAGIEQSTLAFDTMSCVSFSAINKLKTYLKYLLAMGFISEATRLFLVKNKYLIDGEFHFSARFTAIVSSTTEWGNTFPDVANAIRHYGLIPDFMLPFGGNSFYEYMDHTRLTPALMKMGQEFLKHFEIGYEWVFFNNNNTISSLEQSTIQDGITKSPLQIAVPYPAYHAIELCSYDSKSDYETFDSYVPFIGHNKWGQRISEAFRIIATPIQQEVFIFTKTLRLGSYGIEVKKLQEKLSISPQDGIFGPKTRASVQRFQEEKGLVADGIVGYKTRIMLNDAQASTPSKNPTVEDFANAIKRKENMPGSYNNPGALRWSTFQSGIKNGFAVFATYEEGWKALLHQINIVRKNKGLKNYKTDGNIKDFFAVYAPAADGNDALKYAQDVAGWLGVSVEFKIKDLIA